MKIVIIGDGKVGSTLMRQLSKEGHDIVIIDKNLEVLENSINTYDIMAISGNGASYSVQKQAGVDKADILIAATSSDELNMLSCMVARKLGAKNTIARVRNPEYNEQLVLMRDELGINLVFNPEFTAAQEISRILRFPTALKIETFNHGRVELVEIKIAEGSKLDNQPLFSLYSKYQVKILVCAVQRDSEVIIPTGDFIIRAGDKISITATPGQINAFCKRIGIFKDKAKSVMIVGGGRIGHYLTKMLTDFGMSVKLIEINEEKCLALSEELSKAMIIHGDGTNHELLSEEGIGDVDAFVSLTGIDEENIILSMFAKKKNVDKVVTKINKLSFTKLLTDDMVDCMISPKYLIANQIVSYVRAYQNSVGSNVQTLHKIINNQVEVLEFAVRVKANYLGKTLKELKFKDNLLMACIIRNGKIIIPGGNDTIELGDNVIIVTTVPYFRDLNDIFM